MTIAAMAVKGTAAANKMMKLEELDQTMTIHRTNWLKRVGACPWLMTIAKVIWAPGSAKVRSDMTRSMLPKKAAFPIDASSNRLTWSCKGRFMI